MPNQLIYDEDQIYRELLNTLNDSEFLTSNTSQKPFSDISQLIEKRYQSLESIQKLYNDLTMANRLKLKELEAA